MTMAEEGLHGILPTIKSLLAEVERPAAESSFSFNSCLTAILRRPLSYLLAMDPLPRRRKEGGGEIVEVYGFAGWIASLVAYALYLVWAYVPESTLHAVGITYYPSKYWAIAIPSAILVTGTVIILVYIAVNFMSTAPLDSFDTITDMHAKPIVDRSSVWEDGSPDTASRVPNIGDIDMGTVNRVLYQDLPTKGSSRATQRRRRDWAVHGASPGNTPGSQRGQR